MTRSRSETVLAGLDEIDWGRYHHAQGPARNVPGLLRSLVSDVYATPEILARAERQRLSVLEAVSREFYSRVTHQGQVFGVSAKVVPFLVELACADSIRQEARTFAVRFLRHLVIGESSWNERLELDRVLELCVLLERSNLPQSVIDGDAFEAVPDGVDPQLLSNIQALWIRDCLVAVESAVPQLLGLVGTPLASDLVALLSTLHRVKSTFVPALWALAGDARSAIGGQALFALACLEEEGVPAAARVLSDAIDGQHPGAIYAAAADLFASSPGACSAASVRALVRVPASWLESPCPFNTRLSWFVVSMRAWLPQSTHLEIIEQLATELKATPAEQRFPLFRQLISLVELNADDYVDQRGRAVIRLIAEYAPWDSSRARASLHELLKEAGLPRERMVLQALART
ncbi:MAG: hypothetical protein ACOZQL_26375 [Myxococcota bacterium]